jgi:hypothetical protein
MQCVDHMRRVLVRHSNDTFCVEMACNAVVALCMKGESEPNRPITTDWPRAFDWLSEQIIATEEIDVDITSVIVSTLKYNLNSGNVVKSACMSLTSLINLFGESLVCATQ